MYVLVTGGAGFIGSHLVDALIGRGDQVLVIDDFSSGSKSNLCVSGRLEVVEFRLGNALPPELRPNIFDAVVHLAGLPSVSASWKKALEAHDRNLTGTLSLIAACSTLKIPRFIFASSAAVYGLPGILPIPENAPCKPLSPYGLQKRASENYLELFARQDGLCGISLRFFNVYGPRQRPDSAYSGVISIFAEAIKKAQPLTIYGDGSQTRDFIFVADVVKAICGALSLPMESGETRMFNIGTGVRSSLLDVIAALRSAVGGEKPEIRCEPTRFGDISHSQPDVNSAMKAFGLQAPRSLTDGLRALIEAL